eukprot:34764-Pelagomonas_calceolata.AAC.3
MSMKDWNPVACARTCARAHMHTCIHTRTHRLLTIAWWVKQSADQGSVYLQSSRQPSFIFEYLLSTRSRTELRSWLDPKT